jgi:hypothetical protein
MRLVALVIVALAVTLLVVRQHRAQVDVAAHVAEAQRQAGADAPTLPAPSAPAALPTALARQVEATQAREAEQRAAQLQRATGDEQ